MLQHQKALLCYAFSGFYIQAHINILLIYSFHSYSCNDINFNLQQLIFPDIVWIEKHNQNYVQILLLSRQLIKW